MEYRDLLRRNRDAVQARIAAACARAGRDPADLTLIWVSKNHPRERLLDALALGARDFGENRVQEAEAKFPLAPGPEGGALHFIGHLQRNKVRKIVPLADTFHSIDSLELWSALDRVAGESGLRRKVLLQVNTSREGAKSGFDPDALPGLGPDLPPAPNLDLIGLMTMGPSDGNPDATRACFRELAGLLRRLRAARAGDAAFAACDRLSMGMSGDLEMAVEEGAHFLRVGTDLFGPRPGGVAEPKL